MKRLVLIPLLLGALFVPSAQATGTHPPTKPPDRSCAACCGDLSQRIDQTNLVFNNEVTNLRQEIAELRNQVVNLTNYVNEVNLRVTTIINRVDTLSCQSDRVYEYHLRRQVQGADVVAVLSVQVAPEEPRDDGAPRGSFARTDDGRFLITANYQGITAPKLQLRTVMTRVRLEGGSEIDLAQRVRICGPRDGDLNDTPAQERAGI